MSSTPRYCSACGERLSPGDNFCAACGESVTSDARAERRPTDGVDTATGTGPAGETSGVGDAGRAGDQSTGGVGHSGNQSTSGGFAATRDRADAATDDDRRWLRQRVADLRARGWEVTHDDGDRVELIDRGVGSIPGHLLIFLFTSGLGNLLYGWYSWTWGAPERLVTADGHEEVEEGGNGVATLIAAVAALGLLGINGMLFLVALFAGAPSVALSGLLFTLMMLVGAVAFQTDVDTTSLSTFGRERDVDSERVRTPPESCAACGDRVIEGERRRFTDRFYLAGVPLRTYEEGTNTYCADCVADSRDPDDVADLERELERLRTDDSLHDHGGPERERS